MTVRVLVVDDSVVVRRTVATVLAQTEDIDVVGTAADGRLGLRKVAELNPDVVTLDIEMPDMDGLEMLRHVRRDHPDLPVIMYSTLTERGASATFDALELGAVDYATKPSGLISRDAAETKVRDELAPLVRLWGKRRLGPERRGATALTPAPVAATPTVPLPSRTHQVDLVTIGVSTGGPDALARVIPALRPDLPVPVVIVQHMPPVFTAMLAQRLDQLSPLPVSEAVHGEPASPGHVYLAPGGRHLEVHRLGGYLTLELSDDPPENSCRPAVDVLFRSAVGATGGRMLAAVLTGMGQDGLEGARVVHAAGGLLVAQDEPTSVVWGMPGFVARAGLGATVLPLEQIAPAIGWLASRNQLSEIS